MALIPFFSMFIINEDVYGLVYDHIHELSSVRSTLDAISVSKKHPLQNVLYRRILRMPLRFSSDAPAETAALIDFMVHKRFTEPSHARVVQVALAPCSTDYIDSPELRTRIANAHQLFSTLPSFLSIARNLVHLSWANLPMPDANISNVLVELPVFESFSLDCSPSIWLNASEHEGYLSIQPFFEAMTKKLKILNLFKMDQDCFQVIRHAISCLSNLQQVRIDICYGHWEWDGMYDPPDLASDEEEFAVSQICDTVRKLEIAACDTAVSGSDAGPVGFFATNALERLTLYIGHRYEWPVQQISSFVILKPNAFLHLVHFELQDETWDGSRWSWSDPRDRDHDELGRIYLGIHEFISELPQLRHLWVNERCLVVPHGTTKYLMGTVRKIFKIDELLQVNMERTVASPQWPAFATTLGKFESLRVGFGPMNQHWLEAVLNHCNKSRLTRFGFDWDWKVFGQEQPISPELLTLLAGFISLTEIHILHPRPHLQLQKYDHRTISDVQNIFEACPNVYRVGIGRNIVWERRTPWIPGQEAPVQLLNRGDVPDFFNAGSAKPRSMIQSDDEIDAGNNPETITQENAELLNLFHLLST